MKNYLIILLLLACVSSFGQYPVYHNGYPLVINGKPLRVQSDDIPTTPTAPVTPESDFDGTIVGEQSFGGLASSQSRNTDATAIAQWGTGTTRGGWAVDSLYSDSISLDLNDAGVLDTVWRVQITSTGSTQSAYGVDYYVPITDCDSMNLTYFWKHDETFNYDEIGGWGGKTPGIGGFNTDGNAPPTGGVYDCGCGGNEYCPDDGDGFRMSGSYTYSDDQFGIYAYWADMTFTGNYADPYCYTRYGDPWFPSLLEPTEDPGTIAANTWTKICVMVKLNSSVGADDGYVKYAINDTVRVVKTGLDIRTNMGVYIDHLFLNTFAGGNTDPSYYGTVIKLDDFIWWRDSEVWKLELGDVMTNVPAMATPNTE